MFPAMLSAQVTHGVKPQLPAPFATKSAGNPPEEDQAAQGFSADGSSGLSNQYFRVGL